MTSDPRLAAALALVSDLGAGNWSARAVAGDSGDEVDAILAGLNTLAERVSVQLAAGREAESRAQEIMGVIFALAAQDFVARARIADDGSALDGIASGVNMLSEELAASAEAAIRRTSEIYQKTTMLESVVTCMADAVLIADESGRLVSANPAAQRILGANPFAAAGKELSSSYLLFCPDGTTPLPPCELPLRRAVAGEATDELEMRIRDSRLPEDTVIVSTGRPLYDETGAARGGVVIFRDVTAARRASSEKNARLAAEAASEAKSCFLANMSHEIRTPLNGVIGMNELILGTSLTDEQRAYAEAVDASANSLLEVIGDILDFSKIEAGKMDLEVRRFDVGEVVGTLMRTFAARAGEKGNELLCSFAGEIPYEVMGDAGRLRQVLTNLVGNAIKFTEQGEIVVEVSTAWHEADAVGLRMVVRDTGIGIPPEKCGTIFDAFVQGDSSTTRRFGGTGLGLAISSKLVALMGGQLGVASEVGHGSAFEFTARFARVVVGTKQPRRHRTLCEACNGMSVLVVDNSPTRRRILQGSLQAWGTAPTVVDGAPSAIVALEHARDAGRPFSLALVDTQIADSFALAARLRADPTLAGTTILMFSSGAAEGARCRELGVGFLAKPIMESALLDAINRAFGGLEEAPPPSVVDHESIAPLKVLLAEDNPVNQLLATRILVNKGHTVVAVGNGREAVETALREPFDVILMDVQMPEMSGIEAALAIRVAERAIGRTVPIIALTAHAITSDRDACLAAGMNAYLTKPVRAAELLSAIARLTRSGGPPVRAPADVATIEPAAQGADFLDRCALLAGFADDVDILREVRSAFLQSAPAMLSDVCLAVAARDAGGLHQAAHRLKGSMSVFFARRPSDAVARLELMGRAGDLAGAEAGLDELRASMHLLEKALAAL